MTPTKYAEPLLKQTSSDAFIEACAAESRLFATIYPDLARCASWRLRRESIRHQWSPAALINEAYLRITQVYGKTWVNMERPTALWARVMNHVLIDHARSERAIKRGWGAREVYDEARLASRPVDQESRLMLSAARHRLRRLDPRKAAAVWLTADCGMTIDEAALELNVASRTVKRFLRDSREHLRQHLTVPASMAREREHP